MLDILWFGHFRSWARFIEARHGMWGPWTYEKWRALTGPQRDRLLFLETMPRPARGG